MSAIMNDDLDHTTATEPSDTEVEADSAERGDPTPAIAKELTAAELRRDSSKRLLIVIGRFLLVAVAAVSAAVIVQDVLNSAEKRSVALATTGIAVGVVISFLADLMALGSICKQYYWRKIESLSSATPAFWKAWASLTTIILAITAWSTDSQKNEPWLVVNSTNSSSEPPLADRRTAFTAYYAKSAESSGDVGVAFKQGELDVSLTSLERIIAGYKACGSVSPTTPVHMRLVGYASSKEFENVKVSKESNLKNVATANRRAWAGYCYLAGLANVKLTNAFDWAGHACEGQIHTDGGAHQVEVHVWKWADSETGYESMMKARPLEDRPPGISETLRDPEELNRRVDFNVANAGACQKTSLPTALATAK